MGNGLLRVGDDFWPSGIDPVGGLMLYCFIMSTPTHAMKPSKAEAIVLDKAAIGVSFLCVIHCLSIPFILALGPALNLWIWGSEGFHLALLLVVVPLSLVAFGLGYRYHRSPKMLIPGLVGLAIVVIAAILEMIWIGPVTAAIITSTGGVCLIIAHVMNLRAQKACRAA